MSATFSTRVRAAALLSTVSILSMTAGAAFAAPITVTNNPASATNLPAPNTAGGVGSVTMSGATFTNQGMVGAGRYTANNLDFNGDTLGSFSGMTFLRNTWRIDPVTGTYAGGVLTLPDRGPNFGSFFSNYNGRLNNWNFTFSPYAGVNLPQATTSQSQMALTPNGGFFFSDFNGNPFTGLEPGSNTFVQNGFTFGGPATGIGAGRISLDAEAVALARDGTYWVSDEYQAGIFHFSSTGRLIGYIPPTAAVTPRIGGVVDFNTVTVNQTGRRANQGLEGLTLTPDGKTLWVMVQSALMQDSTVNNDALRDVTRLIGYDISTGTPTAPIAEYVMELPVFNRGTTAGVVTPGALSDRTAAQSEILALNGTQFLVLSRDGNGVGNTPANATLNDGRPPVFKSVLLIDTAGATNINGTARQTTAGGQVTSGAGIIDPALVPVQQVQLVNLINNAELTRFGLTLATGAGTTLTTISEKWEAMGLLPTLEESKPQDVFLFVGNDNDFLSTSGVINGGITDGVTTTTTFANPRVNDNMFMVYRLTLPTYVDPLYLEAMQDTAPVVMATNAESVGLSGRQGGRAIDSHLDASRQGGVLPKPGSHSAWLVGSYEDIDPVIGGSAYLAQALNGTAGLETGVSERATVGIAVTASDADVKLNGGFGHDVKAVGGSVYAAYAGDSLFGQISYGYTRQSLDDISRPAAYGLVPKGQTEGRTHAVSAKAGYMYNTEDLRIGPVAAVSWLSGSIDGYTEAGGAGGNVTYPKFSFDRTDISAGFEATVQAMLLPTFHAYYTTTSGDDAKSALVSLASAQNIMGTQAITVPGSAGDVVTLGFGVQGAGSVVRWHMGYDADIGVGDSSDDLTHRVTAGVSFLF